MAPTIEQMSIDMSRDVLFLMVDVDDLPDIAQTEGVRSLPTFVFYKHGKRLSQVVGADNGELQRGIEAFKK
jgi:thioredoxin 1